MPSWLRAIGWGCGRADWPAMRSSDFRKLGDDRIAHFRGRNRSAASGAHEVCCPQAVCQNGLDGLFQTSSRHRLGRRSSAAPLQSSECRRSGSPCPGLRCREQNRGRVRKAPWAAIGHRCAERGRRQHPQRSGEHRRQIGQKIAKEVVGHDHIELLGPAGTAASRRRRHTCATVRHPDIRLACTSVTTSRQRTPDSMTLAFSIEQTLLSPLAGQFKGRTGDACDLGFRVALGVDTDAFVAFLEDRRGALRSRRRRSARE